VNRKHNYKWQKETILQYRWLKRQVGYNETDDYIFEPLCKGHLSIMANFDQSLGWLLYTGFTVSWNLKDNLAYTDNKVTPQFSVSYSLYTNT